MKGSAGQLAEPFVFFLPVALLLPPCLSVSDLGKMPSFKAICSPSPKGPARKSEDEWRGEPSDPSARAYGRRAEALAKEGYGEFCILIIDAPCGSAGSFT
jgi:hypothetical protein